MRINALIFGGVLFLLIGIGLLLKSLRTTFKYQKLRQILISVPSKGMDAWLISVQKGTRFPRTEFSPVIQYQYEVQGRSYSGNKLYIHGDVSYENRKQAEKETERLKRLESIYCDPVYPENSCVTPNVSSSARAHLNGLLGSGIVLCSTGLALLWVGV